MRGVCTGLMFPQSSILNEGRNEENRHTGCLHCTACRVTLSVRSIVIAPPIRPPGRFRLRPAPGLLGECPVHSAPFLTTVCLTFLSRNTFFSGIEKTCNVGMGTSHFGKCGNLAWGLTAG